MLTEDHMRRCKQVLKQRFKKTQNPGEMNIMIIFRGPPSTPSKRVMVTSVLFHDKDEDRLSQFRILSTSWRASPSDRKGNSRFLVSSDHKACRLGTCLSIPMEIRRIISKEPRGQTRCTVPWCFKAYLNTRYRRNYQAQGCLWASKFTKRKDVPGLFQSPPPKGPSQPQFNFEFQMGGDGEALNGIRNSLW